MTQIIRSMFLKADVTFSWFSVLCELIQDIPDIRSKLLLAYSSSAMGLISYTKESGWKILILEGTVLNGVIGWICEV